MHRHGFDRLTVCHRSVGGFTAADIATYYGVDIIRGVILMSSLPHRNIDSRRHPVGLRLHPTTLGPISCRFRTNLQRVRRSLRGEDQLDREAKYSWMGALAGQHPDVRIWSFPHTQNESALMAARKTVSRRSGRLKNLIGFDRSVLSRRGGSTIHRNHSGKERGSNSVRCSI